MDLEESDPKFYSYSVNGNNLSEKPFLDDNLNFPIS